MSQAWRLEDRQWDQETVESAGPRRVRGWLEREVGRGCRGPGLKLCPGGRNHVRLAVPSNLEVRCILTQSRHPELQGKAPLGEATIPTSTACFPDRFRC